MNFTKKILRKSAIALSSLVILGNNVALAAEPVITPTKDNDLLARGIFNQDIEIKNLVVKRTDEYYQEPHMGIFSSGKQKFDIDRGIIISNSSLRYINRPMITMISGNTNQSVMNSTDCNTSTLSQNSSQIHSDSIANFNAPGDTEDIGDLDNPTTSEIDEDIKNINGGIDPKEVVSIEFDFVPKGKKISFEYVFGSQGIYGEELESGDAPVSLEDRYAEGSAMGIWVNGQNKAFIPGTNLPVNTVNIDNEKKYVIERQNEIYTRRTPAFTAESEVNANEVNHLKIAFGTPKKGEPSGIPSAIFLNGTISDFPQEEPGVIEEEPKDESGDKEEIEEKPKDESGDEKEIIENPKTGDLNLTVMTFSTLASVSGLVVLVKKRKKN